MKYKYNIKNLDCANCAKRIEDALNKQADFKNVVVNFSTSKLSFQTDKEDIDFSRNIMYNYGENSLREDGPMDS